MRLKKGTPVEVDWLDASKSTKWWAKDELVLLPSLITSIGYVAGRITAKGGTGLVICDSYHPDKIGITRDEIGGPIFIPDGCITHIRHLKR